MPQQQYKHCFIIIILILKSSRLTEMQDVARCVSVKRECESVLQAVVECNEVQILCYFT